MRGNRQPNADGPLVDNLLDAIGAAFEEKEIPTRDWLPWRESVGISAGPVTMTFYYRLARPSQVNDARKMGDVIEQYVAHVLQTPPGEKAAVRIQHAGAHLLVELPRPNPWRPTIRDIEERAEEMCWLGYDRRNNLTTIDLLNLQTGLMVVGTSGSGKTNALSWLVLQALEAGWLFALIDLKGGKDWHHWAPWATWGPAYTEADADATLDEIMAEMRRRNSPDGYRTPPIVLVFDELPAASNTLQKKLAEVSAQGRSAGMRILVGTQSAGEDIVHLIRKNLRSRLVGLVAGKSEANNATNQAGSGAELLRGRGDMLLTIDNGPLERLQIPQAIDDDGPLPGTWRRLTAMPKPDESPRPAATPGRHKSEINGQNSDMSPFDVLMNDIAQQARADGGEPPPMWLVARAMRYAERHGKVPTFSALREWSEQHDGKMHSDKKLRLTRDAAYRWLKEYSAA